jgi:uncharacterized protein
MLIASAAALGLAGLPHCAAMCAAPCAAACGGAPAEFRTRAMAFQVARLAGYATAGAVAAGSVGALAALSQWSPALRPVWALFHSLVLALGLWFVWAGRQPAWMGQWGRTPMPVQAPAPAGWQQMRGPARAATAGALWVAWPCGLLQSALLVASLANTAAGGALAMAGFGLASSAGLMSGPWLWARLRGGSAGKWSESALIRASGVLLVLGSGFALVRGVWHQIAAFCGWA